MTCSCRMRVKRALFTLMLALATAAGATASANPPALPAISLAHFNHLYADLDIGGKQIGVLHIYATFPDYAFAIEPKEGYACVDDVSRAIVLLAQLWRRQPQPELLAKIRRLTEFVLYLQDENGYFHNFLWGDMRINTSYRTSLAELNWWSLRALRSLEEALPLLDGDAALAERIRGAAGRVAGNLERDLPGAPRSTTVVAGLTVPAWLPAGSGADQAAQAILALLPHYRRTGRLATRQLIEAQADGLLLMQKGGAGIYPYGMFLSWQNTWHAWGNDQAYALLEAGEALERRDYVASALKEVDNFYPYLLKTGMAESIQIRAEGKAFVEVARSRYPQIAYGVRPMIYAALKAHALTKDDRYRSLALQLGAWLLGRNDAGLPMYNPQTGVVFDGIIGAGRINRNAGAESAIEALLALEALKDGLQ